MKLPIAADIDDPVLREMIRLIANAIHEHELLVRMAARKERFEFHFQSRQIDGVEGTTHLSIAQVRAFQVDYRAIFAYENSVEADAFGIHVDVDAADGFERGRVHELDVAGTAGCDDESFCAGFKWRRLRAYCRGAR